MSTLTLLAIAMLAVGLIALSFMRGSARVNEDNRD